tara:strand:- start:85 stop:984 length:900 start_codon:yes stop_codon:yes gene_type:complete
MQPGGAPMFHPQQVPMPAANSVEIQTMKDQLAHIDQLLRQPQNQQHQTQLKMSRQQLLNRLLSMTNPQPVLHMPTAPPMQVALPGMHQPPMHWPQQPVAQPPLPPKAVKRHAADLQEVKQRAYARLSVAANPAPDHLGPDAPLAAARRRMLLEAHEELERNSGWMEQLFTLPAENEDEPAAEGAAEAASSKPAAEDESSSAVIERLQAWEKRGEELQREQDQSHDGLRDGIRQDAQRFGEQMAALKAATTEQELDAVQSARELATPGVQFRKAELMTQNRDVPTPSVVPPRAERNTQML